MIKYYIYLGSTTDGYERWGITSEDEDTTSILEIIERKING